MRSVLSGVVSSMSLLVACDVAPDEIDAGVDAGLDAAVCREELVTCDSRASDGAECEGCWYCQQRLSCGVIEANYVCRDGRVRREHAPDASCPVDGGS
ncbi:MAG: hypothetical protein M3Y87_23455 [Myxococcota bacterium]|nr:hypothetical protein [Myxococcota bacterium]